jgi:cytochrome c peroxidase
MNRALRRKQRHQCWPRGVIRRIIGVVSAAALYGSAAVAQVALERPSERPWEDVEPITPIPPPPRADPKKVAIGERLFGDTRLSADGRFSCSSCHDIRTNGIDSKTKHAVTPRTLNTLTVLNAALSYRLTWEGQYRSLYEQAEASITDPANMHSSVEEAVRRLRSDIVLNALFRAAYGRQIDRANLLDALVTFEQSLLTPGSRFDRWLEGDASALSVVELEGYRTFKALGCSACHQGVNAGANFITRQGIFSPLVLSGPSRVRVPSLRNVEATPPYFHDGSAATLEDAVRRMATAQLDRTLTDEQVRSIVAYLKTLTGNYRGKPVARGTQ